MVSKGKTHIKSLATTTNIIEGLEELGPSTISELSEHLGIPQSTVYVHLDTLRNADYIVKDHNKYQLSFKFLNIGGKLRRKSRLRNFSVSYMEELATETSELVNLMVPENNRTIYLHKEKGDRGIDPDLYLGKKIPYHLTAAGKVILAHMPEERAHQIVEQTSLFRKTRNTITDENKLLSELCEIRDQGYAIDDQERLERVRSIAAPIRSNGKVLGGISVSGPSSQISGERFTEELPQSVINKAEMIEIYLEYSNVE